MAQINVHGNLECHEIFHVTSKVVQDWKLPRRGGLAEADANGRATKAANKATVPEKVPRPAQHATAVAVINAASLRTCLTSLVSHAH